MTSKRKKLEIDPSLPRKYELLKNENERLKTEVDEVRRSGWNEQRIRKLRMLEHFQARFVHIMGSTGSCGTKLNAFTDLLIEFKWIPKTEILQMAGITEEEYFEKLIGEFPPQHRDKIRSLVIKNNEHPAQTITTSSS